MDDLEQASLDEIIADLKGFSKELGQEIVPLEEYPSRWVCGVEDAKLFLRLYRRFRTGEDPIFSLAERSVLDLREEVINLPKGLIVVCTSSKDPFSTKLAFMNSTMYDLFRYADKAFQQQDRGRETIYHT